MAKQKLNSGENGAELEAGTDVTGGENGGGDNGEYTGDEYGATEAITGAEPVYLTFDQVQAIIREQNAKAKAENEA